MTVISMEDKFTKHGIKMDLADDMPFREMGMLMMARENPAWVYGVL